MTPTEILRNLVNKRGHFGRAKWRKVCKTRKGFIGTIEKETEISMRAGVDYDKMHAVIECRESGDLPEENQGLPWGEWQAFPYLIGHKGEQYARLYPNAAGKIETHWFLNGKESTLEEMKQHLLASDAKELVDEIPTCVTVKLKNILELI